jgi:hypothetical protein
LLGYGGIHRGTAFYSILSTGTDGGPLSSAPSSAVFSEGFSVVLGKVAQTVHDLAPGSFRPFTGLEAQFVEVFPPTLNNAGEGAFSATTNAGVSAGALGAAGIWAFDNDKVVRKVALAGETAPGAANNFASVFDDVAVINNDGDIAFKATLVGSLNRHLWVERDGALERVAYQTGPAADTSKTFRTVRDPLIDEAGRVAFVGELEETSSRDGLWRETTPGALHLVALEGQQAPGTSVSFRNILDIAMNAGGQLAFKAQLSNFKSGIFSTDSAGTVHKVIVEGDTVQVDDDLMLVNSIDFAGMNGSVVANGLTNGFNDEGQVAFFADFDITDLHPEGLRGVFVAGAVEAEQSADFDDDGDVDGADFLTWQRGFGGAAAYGGDFNGDSTVNGADLTVWKGQFGQFGQSGLATAVAEPCSAFLAVPLLAGLAATSRRRRVG